MGGAFGAMAGLMANTLDQGQRDAQERAMARMRASGMAEDTEEKQYNFAQTKKQDAAREKMLNDPSLPPEVKQWLSMGASPADVMKMQNQRKQGQVESLLLQLPDPATRQKLWSMMQGSDPSLVVTPAIEKMLGIGEKAAAPNIYADWKTEHPTGTPEQFKALSKEGGGDTELKQVYHHETGTTTWDYVPKTGAAGTSAGEVRPPMGSNAIADANAASEGLTELQDDIKGLNLTPGQEWMPNWATVARQKLGFASDDPRITDMLAQVSVINTTLTGMVMRSWGTRNVAAAQEVIRLHVPTPSDSPKLINQKIDWWQKYGLQQYKTMLGATPDSGKGTAVYLGGKLIGYTTDRKTFTPVP